MKDFSEMSSAEIKLYQQELTNEYEVLKNKISEILNELDKLDKIYNCAEKELNKRKNKVFK